jgi:hypothetical protein
MTPTEIEPGDERGWQPIESAPRDWTDVLVFSPEHEGFNCQGVFSSFYDTESGQWLMYTAGGFEAIKPTHWIPLPTPPTGAE